jgi:hypothetical protein
MSVTSRYRVSVPLPAARSAFSAVRPRSVVASRGVTGALAGSAAGVAAGVGAAGFVPGVDLAVLIAIGVLFGSFNGGLVGLMSRLEGK